MKKKKVDDKAIGYWCSMSWGLSARYHAKCTAKACECDCHSKQLKEIRDIKARNPDLYKALAKDDPSLIGKKKKK